MKKVLFTATVDSHILAFHTPYLKYFKNNGYEVHVATNGDAKIPFCDVKHVVSFERSPFKPNNLKAIRQLKKICDTEQFDIIHTHTPMGSVVTRLAAMHARKKYNTYVIYTAHGFHFFKGAPAQNWLIFYPVEKLLARKTDTLITINKEDYELAKKKFKTDVQYIPGVGVDSKKFDFSMTEDDKTQLRKSLGLKKSDFVMIYPAELNKNKNQLLLINAMKKIVLKDKDIKLLLPGKDNYNGYYQRLVKDYGLTDKILFLNHRGDIPQLLQVSNVSVSTSLREGLPVNVMEAMCTGMALVVSPCRGNLDLVKDGKNGYIISNNDHDSLVNIIIYLKYNVQITAKMGVLNKKDVAPYLLDQTLIRMQKIYSASQYDG